MREIEAGLSYPNTALGSRGMVDTRIADQPALNVESTIPGIVSTDVLESDQREEVGGSNGL